MTAAALAPLLLAWWDEHGRKDLPWQRNPTPYRVWVSEVMLQQTQVATVTRYYDRFLDAFPDVIALADAPLDTVLHHWSGLGYYARARNLHRAAIIVRDRHGGGVPEDFDALAALPGIGRSTAGAILALATDRRFPILDGNVKRVLARVFRIEGWPGELATGRRLWELAAACTPTRRVAHYTQAIMDLGASVCARRKPACDECPLATDCRARAEGVVLELPARRPARSRPRRASVLVLLRRRDGAVLLERRPEDGIWGGLWGFPEAPDVDAVAGWCQGRYGVAPTAVRVGSVLRHAFSHFDLDMTPVEVIIDREVARVADSGVTAPQSLWYNTANPAEIGLAAPVLKLLHTVP